MQRSEYVSWPMKLYFLPNKRQPKLPESLLKMVVVLYGTIGGKGKGLSINNLRNLAPGFGPDLDGTIEEKPRHSLDYVEIFSIEARSKMAQRWDARWEGYLLTGSKMGKKQNPLHNSNEN